MKEEIKYIRLFIEYGAGPIWLYADDGVIDTDFPKDWNVEGTELDVLATGIAEKYDSLFVNNDKEFSYIGFNSDEDKSAFCNLLDRFAHLVFKKNCGEYRIVNDLKFDGWHSSISS